METQIPVVQYIHTASQLSLAVEDTPEGQKAYLVNGTDRFEITNASALVELLDSYLQTHQPAKPIHVITFDN